MASDGTRRLSASGLLLLVSFIGIFGGLYALTATGQLRRDGGYAELMMRTNDFENYARHRASNSLGSINPIYKSVIEANQTLVPTVATLLRRATNSDIAGRMLGIVFYLGAFALALPFLVYAFTNSQLLALAVAVASITLPLKEAIYGYTPTPITGNAALSLYLLSIVCIVIRRPVLAFAIALLQFLVHPTTGLMWAAPLLVFFVLSADRMRGKEGSTRLALLAVGIAPVLLGLLMFALERGGYVFADVDRTAYWAIVRVRTLHSVFLDTERGFLIVVYLGMVASLAILGWSKKGNAQLNLLNKIAAVSAIGIFSFYALFVETEASIVAAATLPLRYATFMEALLIANLASVIVGARGFEAPARITAGVILAWLLLGSAPNPVFGVVIWSIGQRWLEGDNRRYWLIVGIAAGGLVTGLLLLIPMVDSGISAWYLNDMSGGANALAQRIAATTNLELLNVRYVLLIGKQMAFIAMLVFAASLLKSRPLASMVTAAVLIVWSAQTFAADFGRLFPLSVFWREMVSIVFNRDITDDSSAALVRWIDMNIPDGAAILSDPDMQLRRTVRARVSVDSDILSLLPYAPATAVTAVNEIQRDYGLDLRVLAKNHGRIWDALNTTAWVTARNKVLETKQSPYAFVVEMTTRPPSIFEPIFFNEGFRVYKVGE